MTFSCVDGQLWWEWHFQRRMMPRSEQRTRWFALASCPTSCREVPRSADWRLNCVKVLLRPRCFHRDSVVSDYARTIPKRIRCASVTCRCSQSWTSSVKISKRSARMKSAAATTEHKRSLSRGRQSFKQCHVWGTSGLGLELSSQTGVGSSWNLCNWQWRSELINIQDRQYSYARWLGDFQAPQHIPTDKIIEVHFWAIWYRQHDTIWTTHNALQVFEEIRQLEQGRTSWPSLLEIRIAALLWRWSASYYDHQETVKFY